MTAPIPAPTVHGGRKRLGAVDEVATLLLAMGKPAAGRLLKYFDEDEIKRITRAAVALGPVSPGTVETVVDSFVTEFSSGATLVGTVQEVEKLLTGLLPADQVADILAEVRGNANRSVWERMSSVSESVLASYLVKEHPQTAALILSRIKPAAAAKVMGHLPQALRNSLMRRMLTSSRSSRRPCAPSRRPCTRTSWPTSRAIPAPTPTPRWPTSSTRWSASRSTRVLTSLSESRPKSAEILKDLLFTFDDIVKLAPRARTALFDAVPNDRLVLALKGTDAEFRNLILGALSARVRRMVEHELNGGEPAAQRDVMEARRGITDLALEMAGRGEIEINAGGEEEALVR